MDIPSLVLDQSRTVGASRATLRRHFRITPRESRKWRRWERFGADVTFSSGTGHQSPFPPGIRAQVTRKKETGEGKRSFGPNAGSSIALVGRVGLEPTTKCLKGACSTIELTTRVERRNTMPKSSFYGKRTLQFCDATVGSSLGIPNEARQHGFSCRAGRCPATALHRSALQTEIQPKIVPRSPFPFLWRHHDEP